MVINKFTKKKILFRQLLICHNQIRLFYTNADMHMYKYIVHTYVNNFT